MSHWAAAVLLPVITAYAAAADWTIETSVNLRYFVTNDSDPGSVTLPTPGDAPAHFSPDGAHFFFLSWHGDLEHDQTVYDLWIYDTAEVSRALRAGDKAGPSGMPPLRKVTLRSGFPGDFRPAAIYMPVWETNSTITFAGTEGRETRRVYRYDILTAHLTPLTERQYLLPDMGGNTYSVRGRTVMFQTFATPPVTSLKDYPRAIIGEGSLARAYDPQDLDYSEYHVSYQGRAARTVAQAEIGYGLYGPWISPDEKWAVVVYPPKDAAQPAEWSAYDPSLQSHLRFMLVQLESGVVYPMLHAPAGPWMAFNVEPSNPIGESHAAFWGSDNRHVLLINAALPLDDRKPERLNTSYVLDFDVMTLQWKAVDTIYREPGRQVSHARWLEEGRSVLVSYENKERQPAGSKVYRFAAGGWSAGAMKQGPHRENVNPGRPFTVRLIESANDPQRIVASDGKNELTLTDRDPVLDGVWRAPVEAIDWKDDTGNWVHSLLMLPRDFSRASPPPLIIQWSDSQNPANAFRPDGEPGTGFAAQALAAQGFVVLQTEPSSSFLNAQTSEGHAVAALDYTPQEGPAQVARLDQTMRMLKARGVTADAPIGLIGFSRSGYHVQYLATHPGGTRIGAGVVFDSITYGFADYVLQAGFRGRKETQHYGQQYGNRGAFWVNKEGWMDAPEFNLEKLTTPMLFTINGPPIWAVNTVGAYQLAWRPFEYQNFSSASHLHKASAQRAAAMQSTVDWMNFWLKGRERPDAADQYARWRQIKADWEQTQMEEAQAAKPAQ